MSGRDLACRRHSVNRRGFYYKRGRDLFFENLLLFPNPCPSWPSRTAASPSRDVFGCQTPRSVLKGKNRKVLWEI